MELHLGDPKNLSVRPSRITTARLNALITRPSSPRQQVQLQALLNFYRATMAHVVDESINETTYHDLYSPFTRFISHYDITLLICEFLRKNKRIHGKPWVRIEKDLFSMATVCKRIFEPAMDVLWRELGNLLPLLKIIPNFIIVDGIYTVDGLVSNLSLARFDSYTRRVRILRGSIFPSDVQVNGSGLTYLTSLRSLPLVPHLMNISIQLAPRRLLEATLLLRSPIVTRMHLCPFPKREEFLHSVFVNSQSLTELILHGESDMKLIDYLATVHTLKSLVLFSDTNIHQATHMLILLSKLPALTSLSLVVRESQGSPRFATNTVKGRITFNSLRIFSIWSTMSMISVFLRSISADTLKDLDIRVFSSSDLKQTSLVMLECTRSFRHLVDFKLQKAPGEPTTTDTIAQEALLQMLSEIRAQSIRLLNFIVPMNDEDIQQFCDLDSTHSLRVIHLNTSSERSPTLSCLHSFTTSYLQLKELRLCFDITEDNISALQNTINTLPRVSHGLKTLIIGRVQKEPLRDAYRLGVIVSQYIDHLFPHLGSVQSGINIDEEWCNGINAILAILKSHRQIRSSTTS